MTDVAVHAEPVWRAKADFIFFAAIPDAIHGGVQREQLWGRVVGDRVLEVCCVPFMIYDVALGDIVEVDDDNVLKSVVSSAGRYVFRMWLDAAFVGSEARLLRALDRFAVEVERYSARLLAVDVPTATEAQRVADLLQEFEDAGLLEYETGRMATEHRD